MHHRTLHTWFSVVALVGLVGVIGLAGGCDDKTDVAPPVPPVPMPAAAPDLASAGAAPAPASDLSAAAPEPPSGSEAKDHPSLFVRSSRCGECHEKMRTDWSGSAHSRASHSPAYRKSLAAAGELAPLCQSCHLPSLAYGQPDEQASRPSEGVSCDGCHTLSAVTVAKTQATMKFDPSSGSKYGPIPGATGHYFHDMAYSVLHTKSEVCAGCHHLTAFKLGDQTVNIPVVSDYSDAKLYGKGKTCQDCHMPSRGTEPVAKGAKPRPNVPAHLFPGAAAFGKQIRFEPAHQGKPGEVGVEIQHTAGHALPSGYVDRRLIVRAEFLTATGVKVATIDRSYGIKLVDAAGKPAPFFRAARIAEDRRMLPGKLYSEFFPIPSAPAGAAPAAAGPPARVTLSLLAAPTDPELSAVYGEPELTVLKSTSLTLPARSGGR